MAGSVKHVRKRNGVYQYERRVPQDIMRDANSLMRHFNGSKLFRRSLKTSNDADVLREAEIIRVEFEARAAAARGMPAKVSQALSIPLLQLTQSMLDEVRDRSRWTALRPWARQYALAQQGGVHGEELQRMQHEREMDGERLSTQITEPGARSSDRRFETPLQAAEQYVLRNHIDAPDGSQELSLISIAMRDGMIEGERDIDRLLAGQLPPQAIPGMVAPPVNSKSHTLREIVELYVSEKSLRPKTTRDILKSLELFEQHVGSRRLNDLTRKDFTKFVKCLADKQIGGRAHDSITRMISPDTVAKRLTFLRSAINYAIKKDIHEGGNPASNIDVTVWVKSPDKSIMRDKRGFNVGELNLLFRHPWFTGCKSTTHTHVSGSHRLKGAHFWVPVVALFSGCRASELGGLMLSEIDIEGPHPHFHIRDNQYRPTKGGYARFVPVLDELMTLGFGEYVIGVKRNGADRVFPDWVPPKRINGFSKDDANWSNANIIRAFNRTVIANTLGDRMPPGTRQELTFHSFRGAFKAMLGSSHSAAPPNVINEVIGHSKSELDKRYVGTVPIEETYAAIHARRWPGLLLPSSPFD